MAEKKNILTYTGLKKYEDELHDLKVNKRQEIAQRSKRRESRATCLRTLSMMQQKMNRETSRQES